MESNDDETKGGGGGGADGGSKSKATDDNSVCTIAYLRQMIYYAEALAHNNNGVVPKTHLETKTQHQKHQQKHTYEEGGNGESLVNVLARELLLAADPVNLRSLLAIPAAFLPEDMMMDGDEMQDDEEEEDDDDSDDEEEDNLPYKINPRKVKGGKPRNPTRIDALRSLLRSLAPVAMDVAARAACHVLMSNRSNDAKGGGDGEDATNDNEGEKERLQAFVLFGFWLPLAPQLAPIISDLFGEFQRFGDNEDDVSCAGCPLVLLPFVANKLKQMESKTTAGMQQDGHDDMVDAEAAVVASEAAHELLEVYCCKRYENDFVRRWWDWDSCLFILIHAGDGQLVPNSIHDAGTDDDGDVVMNANETKADDKKEGKDLKYFIGGYSPETDAPHCTHWKSPTFQMKWHASRAVGALFALRPLPLSKFLKTLCVFEDEVPFVRHPWTIDMEDAVWENNLLRSVGKVVLPKVENVKIKFGNVENEALVVCEGSESAEMEADDDEDIDDEHMFQLPSIEGVRRSIPLHPTLIHAGRGILIPRRGSVASYDQWCRSSLANDESQMGISSNPSCCFVPTDTTMRNMSLLGIAMSSDPHPPPILVCGPPGSGKSSLVREMARLCSSFTLETTSTSKNVNVSSQEDELLELHVDEETDSKTLLGSFVATDIPGEFVWMAGPLTSAARLGRWVLIEDVDRCPEEIQAALIRLLEERILPLGVGKDEKCHPRFRLFGTCVTNVNTSSNSDDAKAHNTRRKSVASIGAGGKRILHPNLWRKVHVDPLPFTELREVGRSLHPDLPHSVADTVLEVLRKLDRSGRGDNFDTAGSSDETSTNQRTEEILGHGSRHASVREFIKLLSRISAAIKFEPGSDYATETQRLLCLAETVDVFAMPCPSLEKRRNFICQIAAPTWSLTADAATRYIETRIPTLSRGGHSDRCVEVGRARLLALNNEEDDSDMSAPGKKRNFAETHHALRLMESVAVCASQNEPALLVGETGCGKTTLVQRLANLTGRTLLVQNLSLQTDSTDLLGGYKPLEMRHVARGVYDKFVDLFVSSFSRSQNAQFLKYVLTAFEKGDWKKLAQCFTKAAGMGENKMRELTRKGKEATNLESWADFRSLAERFERQRIASESGLAFLFTEGALVDAIRTGKWVLLDEINLASSETLQRLCGLLDDSHGSITLTEKGDAEALNRHPDFRLFAAMNPATDAGKKDLPASIRSRFTEIYVDELVDPVQLRSVAARYLDGAVTTNGVPLEHSESVMSSVDIYLQCRLLSDQFLVDGGGQKPRYTMRTLCRTLSAARTLIIQQRFAPQRAILEGFQLAFEGSLDLPSRIIIQKQFTTLLPNGMTRKERDHPGRRPDGRSGSSSYVLIKPFWIKSGKEDQLDWADPSASSNGKPKFVLTPSATSNLRRLCQAVASGPWSILLEGPTSAGKTTLVEYLAARCGHRCVRINNHEHTDIQEYTGSYAADSKGKISFQEGILVQALRKGHWVILDELNLAPSEVLEALNRLLDDNRELFLPEINEAVKPHENFRLFATQNPAGAYGGRKPLSRAFRNRFVEIHMSDIPEDEMVIILERRCGCPPSHAKLLVKVMKSLRQRRSRTGIFRGKDGLITPRDLLRWAGRGASSKTELALEGYMLLAERLRIDEEKEIVQRVIEKELKVSINVADAYYGEKSDGRVLLEQALSQTSSLTASGLNVNSIAPTQSIMRLLTLVMRCIKQKEPVLLVGDTGCGKTTVVQLLSVILQRKLTVVNCHASTETSDLLGGFRPVRGRQIIAQEMIEKAVNLVKNWSDSSFNIEAIAPPFITKYAYSQPTDVPQDSPKQVIEFLRVLVKKYCNGSITEPSSSSNDKLSRKKRRKLSNGKEDSVPTSIKPDPTHCQLVESASKDIESLHQKCSALFEWADGPLVCSMRDGSLLLLDEMSLAEDAVLERLNSVLEPSRTLTLAEKGGEGPSCVHGSDIAQAFSSEIRAHEDFRIFATMNPGGDFGKRELSPALRSRFTEIWVPPVSQRSDIDLVLERSFLSVQQDALHNASITAGLPEMRQMMLDYFDWFNVAICDDPNSFCNDFKLSLRDVLSWARFVADVFLRDKTIDQHAAYVHGASLMHLDGLGLGTGVSNQDATATRTTAKEFLLRQISNQDAADVVGFQDELKGIQESIVSTKECFGVKPFTIPMGDEKIPTSLGFNLTAPTTGLNLRRVLRGMQISKPILLEGSPGVGKTSLIQALAKASGHNLVRINLSEQTDISDLMGSDLPGENDGNGASFRWCDGVLLKAIKRGDWVLLDELNLASQSVLEGLNSCLDHRASVYIPELGREFACPATFRIFAAQNPLAQGGGRKGLPKSFLNRFTKVYIEALTNDDLFSIVAAQFPSIPAEVVEKMIHFNKGVQCDIDSRLYGQHGSPWEFNLRDIFRWCQLLQSNGSQLTFEHAAKYADMLYTQRLRTDHDRELIENRLQGHFGCASKKSHPRFEVTEESVLVGTTSIERVSGTEQWADVTTQESEPGINQLLIRPMEAVACCVRMNWPCLLIGPSSSGKSALLKTLADASNVHIETLAMTSSTDVTELIGCFEQTDSMEGLKEILMSMKRVYDGVCSVGGVDVKVLHRLNRHYWQMKKEIFELEQKGSPVGGNKLLLSTIGKLVKCYENIEHLIPDFSKTFAGQISLARQWLSSSSSTKSQSPFQWVDGILVKAMERGYWLHLENVNFCPSSVLDRLNPLMEFGGELVMTECGTSNDDQGSNARVIKPHPNFRLFLSMNPSSHGKVSRAMRNRCIEVCVLPPAECKDGTIDAFTALWDSQVRSHNTGHCMIATHQDDCRMSIELQEEPNSFKTLKGWGAAYVGLLKRGMAHSSFSASHQILYQVDKSRVSEQLELASSASGLIAGISARKDLTFHPPVAHIVQGSRLLKLMTAATSNRKAHHTVDQFISLSSCNHSCHLNHKRHYQEKLKYQAICRLVEMTPCSASHLPMFYDGFCTNIATHIKVVALLNGTLTYGDILEHSSRVPQLLEESVTYHQLYHMDVTPEPSLMSVVEVSYLMEKKRMDTSIATCPITPLIFPFFQSIDFYLSQCHIANNMQSPTTVMAYKHLLLCRDKLWQCLKQTRYLGTESKSKIGFMFTGFLIQYCWIKKSFTKFRLCLDQDEDKLDINSAPIQRSLLLSFETIDDSIQESTGGSILSSDLLWKKGGHPLLPSKLDHFEELRNLNDLSNACTLAKDEVFGFTRMVSPSFVQIDLKELIASNSPSLFVQKQFSKELLGALAMAFWASTNETKGVSAKDYSINAAPKVLLKRFKELEADFIANVHLATIDTSIQTVDNALDMDEIKSIVQGQMNSSDAFLSGLLASFGDIQAAQIGEVWCVLEEGMLIGRLSEVLRQYSWPRCDGVAKILRNHCFEIKAFINKSVNHTQWPIGDLRPYQTLLWALESNSTTDDALLHIMCSILPRMIYSHHNHQWCNTYNDLDSISSHLSGPSLWNREDSTAPKYVESTLLGQSVKNTILMSCAGPTRAGMNVSRSAIFRLLRLPSSGGTSAYLTMENSSARRKQAKNLLPLFASKKPVKSHQQKIEVIKYLLGSVLNVLQEVPGQVNFDVRDLLESQPMKTGDVAALFKNCEDKRMQSHINKLVMPLIENIRAINESKEGSSIWKNHVSLAWIYLGLLRLNLIVPSSPIDPGRRPAAKVEQLDHFLQQIGSGLLSYSLHFGLSFSDFSPDCQGTRELEALAEATSRKRANQEKKIIERPSTAPPFQDLFREIHHFCKTIANQSSVLALVDLVKNENKGSDFRSQEVNWQCSASTFCTRLSIVYSMYEDITIPCINEIRAIQCGLRELALNQAESPQANLIVKTQDKLLQYPFGNCNLSHPLSEECYTKVLKGLLLRFGFGESSIKKQDVGLIHRSFQLASLMRLQMDLMINHRKSISGCDLDEINSLFLSLAQLPEVASALDATASNNADLNEEERDEKEFREYFPNHGAEFERIVASALDHDSDEELDEHQNEESCDLPTEIPQLSDAELSLVISLHKELFSSERMKVDDNLRIQTFISSYNAASHLGYLTEWIEQNQDESSSLGSHLLALALRCNVNRSAWSATLSSDPTKDFHGDPFPLEAIRADLPLRDLLVRIGQLLRAFPGHAVLVALGQVVERVRQLDIQAIPLGKIMSGLEVILRKAQDWEQHASHHVALGKPLIDISSLVASWRKLELQSWSNLLSIRESRRSMQAKRHWPRVYSLIHNLQEYMESKPLATHIYSPSWVWKGYPKLSANSSGDVDTKSMDDLAKVLDTFILTSNIAEFWARLELIGSFASELRNECEVRDQKRLPLARLLQSLCNYYWRFSPLLMQTKVKLREPIEKRLKDEVKLAKWDEQSYYSLAESSEKNHRKLMKFLRDYDEALDTTVLSVLEQNFAEGVRSVNSQAGDHEPITTIPGDASIFPELSRAAAGDNGDVLPPPSKMQMFPFSPNNRPNEVSREDWLAAGLADSVDKYVLRMGHYAERMKSIIPQDNSSAYGAAIVATDITEAIFSRINTLREPKTTKQVKQRALVDLFKCMKEQGYSSMKWSIPSNIRDPQAMLQLPVPSFEGNFLLDKGASSTLERGESYFHRCQVEITRLRFEVSMLGSQYMSQREMTLMQGYSEYILFMMCQQRCMIASMIHSVNGIESIVHSYDSLMGSIPRGQKELRIRTITFEKSLLSLIESLRQVVLLVRETSPLVESESSRGHLHDTVAILSSFASSLEDNYTPCNGKTPISLSQIHHISKNMTSILSDAKSNISSCMNVCDSILPSTIFDSVVNDVNQAYDLALSYNENSKEFESSSPTGNSTKASEGTIQLISSLVQSTLIAVQSICTNNNEKDDTIPTNESNAAKSQQTSTLCENHKVMLEEFNNLHLEKICCNLSDLSGALIGLHDNLLAGDLACSLCTRATISSFSLVHNVLQLSKARLGDALFYYQKHSKLLYILLRVFRVLVSKGFCSDDVSDGGEGDGEGGAGEMKFEDDVEGTGMGEGDGKNDVTDELENEEQLLGLKGDENQDGSSQERKELKEDEVDTGMEMEADFEGEKYDLPDQPEDEKDEGNSENEEEIDREMGDGEDPNEQVVDEKMWDNEEDDLQELQQENEKFEENSKMAGEKLEDEMRTGEGEDDAEKDGLEGQDANQKETPQDESADNEADQLDEMINDDTEDLYEEKHEGVEVRNEDQNASGGDDDDEVDLNNLQLDDGDEEESNSPADNEADNEEIDANMDPDDEDNSPDGDSNSKSEDDAVQDEDDMEDPNSLEKVGDGGIGADENNDPDEADDKQEATSITPPPKSHYDSREALGIAAQDGQDAVKEREESPTPDDDAGNEGAATEDNAGADENLADESKGAGGSGNEGNWQTGKEEDENGEHQSEFEDVPNPFRSPGDAEKFWHKKLDMIQDSQEDQEQTNENVGREQQEEREKEGQFEYTKEGEENSGQVLGIAEDDQAKQLEDHGDDDLEPSQQEGDKMDIDNDGNDKKQEKRDHSHSSRTNPNNESADHKDSANDSDESEKQLVSPDDQNKDVSNSTEDSVEEDLSAMNRTITDRMQLQDVGSDDDSNHGSDGDIREIDFSEGLTLEDIQHARAYWQTIQSDTNNLSRRLCEKLRLVMEPLVATKLRGDYRTGKRVNMKRIIGYIASGYRKDKIWLRRTKPAKRDYRVLIAVDDSESMQKSEAGDMALRALATLANGMSQLEIGQLGIASFGEDMKLLHPFNIPFTSESGVNIVSNFTFNAKRTRTALCVESSIAALDGASSVSSSMQLVFMISDGRIERDSRSKLRRLIRQMAEKNMLMVMIIVEGDEKGQSSKSKDSILNMKEVSFVNGKPNIKHFIEDYPFPYYLVVGDLAALPEILGDALRQWFEMLAQIQNSV